MRGMVIAVLILVVGSTMPTGAASQSSSPGQSEISERFVGTWRLVSITSDRTNPGGEARSRGVIYYDSTGHMAVQIIPNRERPSWRGRPTAEQALDAITGYTAYFGTYTIDEAAQTVTHHREGTLVPGRVDFVRGFEFAPGDRLILTPVNSTTHLTWERIR